MVTWLKDAYPRHQIGEGSYGQVEIKDWGGDARLVIGRYCSFAAGSRILLGGEHRVDWVTTYPFNVLWDAGRNITGHPYAKGDIVIGHDVWVGTDAVILSGVTIGDGAVIGAGAIVAKDIPPFAIAVGNPARVIRGRFDPETIARLLEVAWWNWPQSEIEEALPVILSADIDRFLQYAQSRRLPETQP